MPSGSILALREVQIGKETTKGTAVPATKQLLASAEVTAQYELFRNQHPIGVLVQNAGPTALLKKDVDVRLTADGVTFEQLAWWLALTLAQPVTTGAGPFVHTFDPGVVALWNPHSSTLEGRWTDGTTPEDVEIEYFTGRRLKLRGQQNGQLLAEVDGFGRQITDVALTSLALPGTLTPITTAMMKYYINDTLAAADALAPASGLVSPDVMGFDLDIDVGQFPWHGIAGATFFAEAKERAKGLTLNVQSVYNPDPATEGGAAERAHAQSEDLRFVTLAWTGPGNLSFYIVVAVKHEMGEFLTIGEQDGLDVVDMRFVDHYDATGAKLVNAVLINEDAAAL